MSGAMAIVFGAAFLGLLAVLAGLIHRLSRCAQEIGQLRTPKDPNGKT